MHKTEFGTTERIKWLKAHRYDPASADEILVRDDAYTWASERYADKSAEIQYAMGFAETLRRKRILIQENAQLAGYMYKYTYNTNLPMNVSPDFDPAGRASFRMDVRREIREAGSIIRRDSAGTQKQDILADLEEFTDAAESGLIKHWHSGHTAAGYDRLVREGFGGILERAAAQLGRCDSDEEENTLRSFMIITEACTEYIGRYEKEAAEQVKKLQMKTEQSPADLLPREKRLAELETLQQTLSQIKSGVPQDFRQALQLVYLAHEMMYCENAPSAISLGRFDQYLYPFYRADIDAGRITPEEASELVDEMWIKISVQRKAYQNVTLGGCGRDLNNSFNDLTYMCLDTAVRLRTDQPSVNFRWTDDMTDQQWGAVIRLIRTGMGFPAIFYDPCCMRAQTDAGIESEDVWDYGFIGCVELTVPGKENAYTELARLNLPKFLGIVMNNGLDVMTGKRYRLSSGRKIEELKTFEEFKTLFFTELGHFTHRILGCLGILEKLYAEKYPLPYLSVLTDSCIERRLDVCAGGAKYSSTGFNLCGIATVADSLAAVRKIVFEDKLLGLSELADLLAADFAGREDIREYAVHRCPKYGNADRSVDHMSAEMCSLVSEILDEYRTYTGGRYRLGLYTVEDHAIMGESTGATPDGRLAGKALSNSCGASQGRDINGPTALINSATGFPMVQAKNGMVLDIKFAPSVIGGETGSAALRALISTYFRKGGMEVQISAVSPDLLKAAQENPEDHADLIVRVSGFSAYFTTLRKTTQDEIIARTTVAEL